MMTPYGVDLSPFPVAIIGLIGLIIGAVWLVRMNRDPDEKARWRYRDRD